MVRSEAGLDLPPEFPGRRDVDQRTPRARLHRVVDVDALDREVKYVRSSSRDPIGRADERTER